MSYETIIVAFDDAARATAAIEALHDLGIPWSQIRRHPAAVDLLGHAKRDHAAATALRPTQPGFWRWLFGGDAEARQIRLYQRAIEHGGTVVSIHVLPDELQRVRDVVDGFGPLDLHGLTPVAA
ncbi:MAG: hypothetical protein INR65_20075 [Gluconacetobacter diazotrophicus]|nr:hypothetical protein [Gluconacetobacter diazotrophicus]